MRGEGADRPRASRRAIEQLLADRPKLVADGAEGARRSREPRGGRRRSPSFSSRGESSRREVPAARRLHFVGAGGVGMSGIAEILLSGHAPRDLGLRPGPLGERPTGWTKLGARIAIGPRPVARDGRGPAGDLLGRRRVATPRSRPRARAGIPVIRRAEMLAEIMRLKQGIARRRHARQDHDDLADGHGPDGGRLRPDDRRRRPGAHSRHERAAGQGRLPRRRGRRVRPLLPGAHPGRRGHHQRRGGPSRHLSGPRGHPGRLRRLRQPRAVLRRGRRLRRRSRRAQPPAAQSSGAS